MSSMTDSAEDVAREFVQAINRGDLDALAQLMTPEHRFVDSLGTAAEGRDAVRAGWSQYFLMVPDYEVSVQETLAEGPVVAILGVARGTYSPDGDINPKNQWETPAAFRALIVNGKVAEWRVYADNEPIRRLMRAALKSG